MIDIYSLTMLLSIITFTFSVTISPGPNNIMFLTSGLTFGYKKTIFHILGASIGFAIMVILVGLGMSKIFEQYAIIFDVLKIVGFLYLLWMAYKIATNSTTYQLDQHKRSKPFSFLQAAAFQWVNPKAWIVTISSISIFATSQEHRFIQVCIIALMYLLAALSSSNLWTLGGVVLKRFIKNEKAIRVFNVSMAIVLVGSVIPFVFE